ncbi:MULTISPECIES: hypothetical protein [Flavobacterium]|jgi:large-conductance mechanosensitive channel|uniref:hypothetical protein n=1 Tax=Flavobacterium TaxID=237 RepID=UPI0002DB32EC|nr:MULTISPECIES: hypothetical protein [Flavobacterium]OXE99464.1 hypothetical protein B0A63_12900 [Flavobacterium johnsoniae UW101]WDF58305.1 hypothetical protein PQ462_16435 [Flavobacterium sp. KACC 22758]WQG80595.1 hypothetical protein SR927_21560 [Flavobacterium johnsoniae UW101]SHL09020.1 hypothetical protein SAMN05444146_2920 [Flavobacterium johnsoniae]
MDKITEFLPTIFTVIVFLVIWFVLRRILSSLSDKINNSEVYKEETLKVLEEIRDELKELNKNNSSKQF